MRSLAYLVQQAYILILIGRVVVDYTMAVNRQWRPQGAMLALVDLIFRLTDPPLRFARRFVPPLRFGGVAIDLSFLAVLLVIQLLVPYLILLLPA